MDSQIFIDIFACAAWIGSGAAICPCMAWITARLRGELEWMPSEERYEAFNGLILSRKLLGISAASFLCLSAAAFMAQRSMMPLFWATGIWALAVSAYVFIYRHDPPVDWRDD